MLEPIEVYTPALGRYRIVGELGRGAMGIVYRAVDPLIERTVAIKTVNLADALDEASEYAARFQLEAKAAGRLAHPNVITIYDAGRESDIAFIAMELLEGTELRSLISQHGKVPVLEAIRIAAQVADGLAYAHQQGVIHRDIKPGNIMILASGLAKIMDFGIARMRSSDMRTKTGVLVGSPKYMSPEQVLGQSIDGRSDIFSLGVVLYEMLTGSTPFSGDTVSNLMYQIATAPALPPSHANPGVPHMLDFILAKALAKDPDHRYQDAAELAADLRRCAEGAARSPLPSLAESTVAHETTVLLDRDGQRTRTLTARIAAMDTATVATVATSVIRSPAAVSKPLPKKEEPHSSGHADALDAAPMKKSREPRSNSGWTWQERLLLGMSVTVGIVVAAFIALT